MRLAVVGVVLGLAAAPAAAEHDKTDVATTDDGSTYIGEIKSVQYATLNLDTDPAGLLSIAWRHITGLTSKFEYRIEVNAGVQHLGTLGPPREPGHLSIVSPAGTIEVDLTDVVEIVPIAHRFWKRLDGSVNFGLTYTQANDALQYNLNGDATYRTRKTYASLTGQSIFNTQQGGDATSQHSLKLIVAQVPKGEWGPFEAAQLQSNPDQGYDLRLLVGGGVTDFLIETSKKLLALNLGVVYDRENVTGASDVDESFAALIGVAFRRFKRGTHSPNLQLNLETFTNITDTPRFRTVFNFSTNWNVIGDFTFSFQVSYSYDSAPPGTDANKNDATVVTSFGYTF